MSMQVTTIYTCDICKESKTESLRYPQGWYHNGMTNEDYCRDCIVKGKNYVASVQSK